MEVILFNVLLKAGFNYQVRQSYSHSGFSVQSWKIPMTEATESHQAIFSTIWLSSSWGMFFPCIQWASYFILCSLPLSLSRHGKDSWNTDNIRRNYSLQRSDYKGECIAVSFFIYFIQLKGLLNFTGQAEDPFSVFMFRHVLPKRILCTQMKYIFSIPPDDQRSETLSNSTYLVLERLGGGGLKWDGREIKRTWTGQQDKKWESKIALSPL